MSRFIATSVRVALAAALACGTVFAVEPTASAAPTPHATRIDDRILDPLALAKSNFSGTANVGTYAQDSILSYAGWQYVAWYHDDGRAILSRRQLGHQHWHSIELGYVLGANDSHNNISMGVSPFDGRLHIAFGLHGQPFWYTRSQPGVASDPTSFQWSASLFEPITQTLPGVSYQNSKITYPTFQIDRGNLLLTYRVGSPSSGDQVLARYNDDASGTWTYEGVFSSGAGTWTGPDGTSSGRNGYLHGFEVNPVNGDLQITWTYREGPGAGGCLSHDLMYAVSPDLGITWYNSARTRIGRTGTDPITVDDPAVVVPIPVTSQLINSESATVDSHGRPHVITREVPPDVLAKTGPCPSRATYARPFHHWRDAAGVWHTTQIPIPGDYGFGRSNILMDKHDTAYLVLPDGSIEAATAKSRWTDWHVVFDASDITVNKETIVDRQRLGEDGVLSVGYQEQSTNTTPTEQTPAAFRVADFRVQPGMGVNAPKEAVPEEQPVPYPYSGTASASSQKSVYYGAAKAFDGDLSTRWVSNGSNPGDGPTAAHPETLTYTYKADVSLSAVTITPNSNYGPRDVAIQVLENGSWRQVGAGQAPPEGATYSFARTTGSAVRIVITSSYDPVYPDNPRNVQIAEVAVTG